MTCAQGCISFHGIEVVRSETRSPCLFRFSPGSRTSIVLAAPPRAEGFVTVAVQGRDEFGNFVAADPMQVEPLGVVDGSVSVSVGTGPCQNSLT